jgi:hypothetical protein
VRPRVRDLLGRDRAGTLPAVCSVRITGPANDGGATLALGAARRA